jgi:hypothetical protein
VIEESIKRAEHLFGIVAIVRPHIAKGNKTANLGDAQLDPEINEPVTPSLPEAAHALCRRV